MLQAIRSKSETYIVKVLFAVLAATFGLWGIGDIFRNWGTDTSVAKVGSVEINGDQVGKEARAEIDQLRQVLPNGIDAEQAKQLGILNTAVERIIGSTLLDLETQRLKLLVGNDTIRQAIVNDPNFKGQTGSFDRNRYLQLLAANQLTETAYEASVRTGMIRNQLTDAVSDGMSPPPAMVDALYRARAEHRIADIVTLTPAAVPAPPVPTDTQISAYYDAHKDNFRSPEERAITVATLKLDDVASTIAVPRTSSNPNTIHVRAIIRRRKRATSSRCCCLTKRPPRTRRRSSMAARISRPSPRRWPTPMRPRPISAG